MKNVLDYEEFWQKVEYTNSCWNWLGVTNNSGYGYFKKVEVHRISYELFEGNIPDKFDIDHICRNRKCVNPAHLQAVTRRENLIRGNTIIAKKARQVFCKMGHVLSVRIDNSRSKGTKRWCETCHYINQKIRKTQLTS